MSKRPSGRGKNDSGIIEKAPAVPALPLIDYTAAAQSLDIDKMRVLRKHHLSLSPEFDLIDDSIIHYRRNLEREVEMLTRDIEYIKHILRSLGKGKHDE